MDIYGLFPTPVVSFNFDGDLSSIQEFAKKRAEDVNFNAGNSTSKNVNVLESEEFSDLYNFINLSLKEYLNTIVCPKDDPELYITLSWLNYTKKGQFHHKHYHPNSLFSGVFYIDTIDDSDKIYFYNETSKSQIELTPKNYNTYNSKTWWLPAKTGTLIIFPSNLDHSVNILDTDSVRISLSFNTFIRGTFGDKQELKWLNL